MSSIIENSDYAYKFDSSACDGCGGHCCTGESGYIWVKYHEIEAISEFLELSVEDFAIMYLKRVKHRHTLIERYRKEQSDYACIFFDDKINRCSIYPVRPLQCRSFPFWEQFKSDEDEVRRECPAII
jgi:Fe-S-cluster containining protein